ncbi:MAG: CPBP family intramembrane glutamic endopeptidase [Woeseiaceae bacterium]|nr:CPBP family intramembrane glutamic endopeptidase [Woeseiaceae bacterium]
MESSKTQPTGRADGKQRHRQGALVDVAIVVAVTLVAWFGEVAVADRLPWGDEGRGVLAVLAAALVAIALTRTRGGTFADLGFRRPPRWPTAILQALGILVAFIVAQNLAPLAMQPFYELPQPDLSRYDAVRSNLPLAIALMLALPLTASIPEEVVYRGFLIARLERVLGGAWSAVAGQALIFGLIHFQWGPGGIFVTTIMGAVWGAGFLLCGRNLWIVIIAHSIGHIAFVLQLYSAAPPN